jgi:hypothetical protein
VIEWWWWQIATRTEFRDAAAIGGRTSADGLVACVHDGVPNGTEESVCRRLREHVRPGLPLPLVSDCLAGVANRAGHHLEGEGKALLTGELGR